MQETLASPPLFDPPVSTFKNLYTKWGTSKYGLLITGQVQIDIRFLSVPGDVVVHAQSGEGEHFEAWKEWARISRQDGTPCIVQLAHPGRMSRKGAGIRPDDMQTLCPSEVPVAIGDSWADKLVSVIGCKSTWYSTQCGYSRHANASHRRSPAKCSAHLKL